MDYTLLLLFIQPAQKCFDKPEKF